MAARTPYRKVTQGQEVFFNAQQWNAMVDATRPMRKGKQLGSQPAFDRDYGVIKVINNCATDTYGYLEIVSLANVQDAFTEDSAWNRLNAVMISSHIVITPGTPQDKFGVAIQPIVYSQAGWVLCSGIVQVVLSSDAVEKPKRAVCIPGDKTQLADADFVGEAGGVEIVWIDGSPGAWGPRCLVRLNSGSESIQLGEVESINGLTGPPSGYIMGCSGDTGQDVVIADGPTVESHPTQKGLIFVGDQVLYNADYILSDGYQFFSATITAVSTGVPTEVELSNGYRVPVSMPLQWADCQVGQACQVNWDGLQCRLVITDLGCIDE